MEPQIYRRIAVIIKAELDAVQRFNRPLEQVLQNLADRFDWEASLTEQRQEKNQMNRPNSQILIARKAVAEVNRGDDVRHRNFADMIENGGYDDHHEMKVALRAIELALETSDRILP